MKDKTVSPAAAAGIITLVVVIVALVGWKIMSAASGGGFGPAPTSSGAPPAHRPVPGSAGTGAPGSPHGSPDHGPGG